MSCPYLAKVSMVFCRAFALRKLLLDSERLSAAGLCCSECFADCTTYREFDRSASSSATAQPIHAAHAAGGNP